MAIICDPDDLEIYTGQTWIDLQTNEVYVSTDNNWNCDKESHTYKYDEAMKILEVI